MGSPKGRVASFFLLSLFLVVTGQNCGFDPGFAPLASQETPQENSQNSDVILSRKAEVLKLVEPFVDAAGADVTKSPGLVIGIVTPTESAAWGVGAIEIGRTLAPTEKTLFGVGSVSKLFTGLILAKYELGGQIRLDELVTSSLPPALGRFDTRVTFSHLVSHYSGLRMMPDNAAAVGIEGYSLGNLVQCLNNGGCAPQAVPGTSYVYSNYGIGLLGYALQNRFAHTDFETMLRSQIAAEAEMSETIVSSNTALPATPAFEGVRYAFGYTEANQALPFAKMGLLEPAGGVVTNGEDMVKLLEVAVGKRTSRLQPVFDRATTVLGDGDVIRGGVDGRDIAFAIDVFNLKDYSQTCGEDFGDLQVYAKPGATTSHTAYIAWSKVKKTGVVVLSNRAGFNTITCLSLKVLSRL